MFLIYIIKKLSKNLRNFITFSVLLDPVSTKKIKNNLIKNAITKASYVNVILWLLSSLT